MAPSGYEATTVARPVRVHWLLLFVLVAAGYALGYEAAQNWFSAEDQGASFFPPAGVTLGALVLVSRRQWPVVLAAAGLTELLLDLETGTKLLACLGLVLANVSEPLVGALLLTSVVAVVDLRRTRDLTAFLLFAVIAAPIVGAAIAASTFVFVLDGSGWVRFAIEWWSGDGLGVLVVGSALIALRPRPRISRKRALEAALLAAAAIAATAVVFEFGWFELIYVPVALLVVVAFRVGTAGVAITGAAVAFIAAGAAAEAKDFWAVLDVSPANRVLYLQLGLAVVIAAALALAAEISERVRIASELARSESEKELALERAELYEAERTARERAELFERHAARLAAAATVLEVGEATISNLESIGASAAWIQRVRGDEIELLAAHGIPDEDLALFARYPISDTTPPAEAVRTASLVEVASAERLDREYPAAAAGRARLQFESLVSAPVRSAAGRVLGVLSLTARDPNWLDARRRQLVIGLAEQCGLALDRALLQVEADRAAADAELLARLGEVLERATGTSERARALVVTLSAELAAVALVHAVAEDGSVEDAAIATAGDPDAATQDAIRRASRAAISAVGPVVEQLDGIRVIGTALRARDRALGTLTVASTDARLTRVLVQRIGTRAALALDNAQLYEQERTVSHSLQLSLLGGTPPPIDGAHIATAYLPGSAALEVGGDWYDVFELPGGLRGLVVGDVVGHGLTAAKAMGQLRGAVRALAPLGGPAKLLENLDVFVESLPEAAMATLAYVELDPRSGRARLASAGHPPPLVVARDARSRLLWEGRSPPLGSSINVIRTEAEERILPDETLVLYTDGLVERRDSALDAMLEELLRTSAELADTSPEELVNGVLRALLGENPPEDDVCVLALRLIGSDRFASSFPADPGEIPNLRHQLDDWLSERGVDAAVRRDIVLAVSEAAANSAEHAYGFDKVGLVYVEVGISDDGTLEASIADRGGWRPPRPDSGRGRGRLIIEALVDDLSIRSGSAGTIVHLRLGQAGAVTT